MVPIGVQSYLMLCAHTELIAYKATIGQTPFQLLYGQEAILSIELELPSLQIALHE